MSALAALKWRRVINGHIASATIHGDRIDARIFFEIPLREWKCRLSRNGEQFELTSLPSESAAMAHAWRVITELSERGAA